MRPGSSAVEVRGVHGFLLAGLAVLLGGWLSGCGGTGAGVCQRDNDCPSDQRCYMNRCQKLSTGQCISKADCQTGELCAAGVCRVQPGDGLQPCEDDGDCALGTCQAGVCRGEGTVPVGGKCNGNADCESGLCKGGECVESTVPPGPAACAGDADCPCGDCRFGVCQGNGCVPEGGDCTGNSDCASGLCVNGQCEGGPPQAMCTSDRDCADGSVCQNGICQGFGQVPNGDDCTGNSDCRSGLCLGGTCREPGMGCRSDDDCAQGSNCTNGTCQGSFQVPNGGQCTGNGDCVSMFCNAGTCADRPNSSGGTNVGPGVPGGTPFPTPDPTNSNNVVVDPAGNIVLPDPAAAQSSSFLWVANDFVDGNEFNGTVSKIDTRTGVEVARYRVGLATVAQQRPSRTAIDLRGNAYVASRALGPNPAAGCGGFDCFADQGSTTKVANNLVDCVDRNGNGIIETSTGPGDVYPYDPATGLSTDECVLWSVPVGPPGAWPRALAIGLDYSPKPVHLDGIPWVGTFYDREPNATNNNGEVCNNVGRAYKLDPRTGAVLNSIQMPINTYGFAVDGNGRMWGTQLDTGRIAAVNLVTETLIPSAESDTAGCTSGAGGPVSGFISKPTGSVGGEDCSRGYGIAVDRAGRVWTAGFSCQGVWRYTPGDPDVSQGTWADRNLQQINGCQTEPCETCDGCGNTRGVAIDGRTPASAWVAHSSDPTRLTRVDVETMEIVSSRTFPDAGGLGKGEGGIGVQSDFDGKIWVVNQTSNNATGYDIDANSFLQAPINAPLVAPYTYSDFTGFALRTFTRPNGSYSQIFPGCASPPTVWGTVTITGTEPPGTELRLRVRTADTLAGLSAATYSDTVAVTPGEAVDISTLATGGSFIQVEVLLISSDGTTSPTLSGMSVTYSCPGSCTDPSNCPGGQTCVNQLCAPCTGDTQCPSGRECINGTCTNPPGGGCDKMIGCKAGQVCGPGQICQPCQTSAQCPSNQFCQNGTCVANPPGGACADASQCAGGQVCVGGQCAACDDAAGYMCGGGNVCRNGTCVPPACSLPSDCPQTQACVGGYCGPCRTNADCGAMMQCVNGSCSTIMQQG